MVNYLFEMQSVLFVDHRHFSNIATAKALGATYGHLALCRQICTASKQRYLNVGMHTSEILPEVRKG